MNLVDDFSPAVAVDLTRRYPPPGSFVRTSGGVGSSGGPSAPGPFVNSTIGADSRRERADSDRESRESNVVLSFARDGTEDASVRPLTPGPPRTRQSAASGAR